MREHEAEKQCLVLCRSGRERSGCRAMAATREMWTSNGLQHSTCAGHTLPTPVPHLSPSPILMLHHPSHPQLSRTQVFTPAPHFSASPHLSHTSNPHLSPCCATPPTLSSSLTRVSSIPASLRRMLVRAEKGMSRGSEGSSSSGSSSPYKKSGEGDTRCDHSVNASGITGRNVGQDGEGGVKGLRWLLLIRLLVTLR